jgi:predicted metal-dependent hydrolase
METGDYLRWVEAVSLDISHFAGEEGNVSREHMHVDIHLSNSFKDPKLLFLLHEVC